MGRLSHVIGVLGGMGPRSTVLLYERLVRRGEIQGRVRNRKPAHILINHIPIANMLDGEPDELREILKEEVGRLEEAGADVIGVACNSAHQYFEEIKAGLHDDGTVLLNLIEEVIQRAEKASLYLFEVLMCAI